MALSHFLKLSPEKQDAIMQAALDEFTEYGYDLASTNRIVESAGIAKGTLFKYFSSKEELFFYLYDKVAENIRPQIYVMDEEFPGGLFEALKIITLRKASMRYRFPKEYALVLLIIKNVNHPVYRKLLDKYTDQSMQYYEWLAQRVDASDLRPGVSRDEAFQLVGFALRGLEDYFVTKLNGIEYTEEVEKSLFREFDRMCELLKYGIYKPQSPPAEPVITPEIAVPARVAVLK